jgi:hypothetical protein
VIQQVRSRPQIYTVAHLVSTLVLVTLTHESKHSMDRMVLTVVLLLFALNRSFEICIEWV